MSDPRQIPSADVCDEIAVGATQTASATCDAGMHAVGGGALASGSGMTTDSSYPDGSTVWRVYVRDESTATSTVRVHDIWTSASGVTSAKSDAGEVRE